jgi:hypothetical protein
MHIANCAVYERDELLAFVVPAFADFVIKAKNSMFASIKLSHPDEFFPVCCNRM